jgi:FtsZ-binding cell division protein ZapB
LNLSEENDLMKDYEIKLTFDELKRTHKIFLMFSSCSDFVDYMKALIENKKILIKKNSTENKITIELIVEYLYKQNIIKIDLVQKQINFELIAQDLYKKILILDENFKNLENNYKNIVDNNKIMKEEIKTIKEENMNIKKENNRIKEEIKTIKEENMKIKQENKTIKERLNNLENKLNSLNKEIIPNKINNNINEKILKVSIDSRIMERDEFDMIYPEIKKRMNKEIKEIKKLYQATVDGGQPSIFHKKCDGVSNTLVLYKSSGNRRFGGFTSLCWQSEGKNFLDKNCFLFSLDKKKIYPPKNDYNYCFYYYKFNGPSFVINTKYCIQIYGNAIMQEKLRTNEKVLKEFFDNEENALSEDGSFSSVYAKEYEVFQIIFY